jgi:acetyl esterase
MALDLPAPVVRALAGRPVRIDGQEVDPEAQLFLRLRSLNRPPEMSDLTPAVARRQLARDVYAVRGRPVSLAKVSELSLPGPAGPIPARLYDPDGGPPGGLLVFFHGGGFVVGDLESHDATCRLIARAAGARVLAVDYRLAPEHRFPAAPQDAWSAYAHAAAHAEELGADPARLAVGGDSAGGNLAAGVAQRAAREGGPAPRLQLLFYPWLELSRRRPSHALFGHGFYLTVDDLDVYASHYLGQHGDAEDPLCSPLLAQDVSQVAPAFIATAGFDPLRDDGEDYARRLHDAGVRVALQRHAGLFHGFASVIGVGRTGREAVLSAAGALRLALA